MPVTLSLISQYWNCEGQHLPPELAAHLSKPCGQVPAARAKPLWDGARFWRWSGKADAWEIVIDEVRIERRRNMVEILFCSLQYVS